MKDEFEAPHKLLADGRIGVLAFGPAKHIHDHAKAAIENLAARLSRNYRQSLAALDSS